MFLLTPQLPQHHNTVSFYSEHVLRTVQPSLLINNIPDRKHMLQKPLQLCNTMY